MEVVVYQQPELLTYYPVCLMCPCRSQRKQPVMQMDLLRKSSGLSGRQGEIEAEGDRESGRCSRIEELMSVQCGRRGVEEECSISSAKVCVICALVVVCCLGAYLSLLLCLFPVTLPAW